MSEEWLDASLASLLSLEYGKALPEKARDGIGFPVLGSAGVVGMHSTPTVRGPGIVVGRKGTAGSVTWVDTDFSPIDTTYWVRLKSDSASLEFTHLLLSAMDLPSVCAQTGVPGLNRDRAYELPVRVPPPPVQRRIVDLMTHLDSHLANLRAEREAANTSRESLVENLLAEVGGEEVRLGDCLSIARGGSPRPIDDYFTDAADGLNWIKIGDVSATGKYITKTAQKIRPEGLSKTRQVKAGDFLLSNSMSFGRPYILHIDGCIHDGWLVLSDDNATFNQDYLYNLLRSRAVQEQFASLAAGSGVKNLNISVVQSVQVNVPSIENQVRVVESVNAWESLIEQLDSETDCLQDIRSTVLGLLLAGEVELDPGYDSILGEVA